MGRWIRMLAVGLPLAVLPGCRVDEDEGADAQVESASAQVEQAAAQTDSSDGSEEEDPGIAGNYGAQRVPVVLGRGGLPVETLELRTYPLRLVNRMEQPALVYADAGAGRVLLDTIGPLDSVRINVEVRAREVTLQATGLTGRPLIAATIAPAPDSVTRWEVRREGSDRL